uniref:Uncharacterized protein n=1 Tax=Rhodosorus marinus TaxID=101924 RepID=A0A7S0BHK5_9RHOD|mmetsp:Transcript_15515/g.22745  ORF Transcript_15515/g.22745 Transcript_15515/m.22745 type:complete len:249 (+) Transcript_15515:611-1357(+)|eukprot:CAMPEP_0184752360 /NCGR_PEP_ID=MMETSP0315-20130426/43538_1 /TAXON_ID=101924 /ORGANISM="Rhodosorus marinus, Strain UTEX LB 2760" /LENGTH=248 /DNA_ID=CAMNT_0027231687 /DNA_START=570 /DNA_END=1316 /DNA_ORIENTATION=+
MKRRRGLDVEVGFGTLLRLRRPREREALETVGMYVSRRADPERDDVAFKRNCRRDGDSQSLELSRQALQKSESGGSIVVTFSRVATLGSDEHAEKVCKFVDIVRVPSNECESMDTERVSLGTLTICSSVHGDESSADTRRRNDNDLVYDIYRPKSTDLGEQSSSCSPFPMCETVSESYVHLSSESEATFAERPGRRLAASFGATSSNSSMEEIQVNRNRTADAPVVYNEYGERDGYENDDEGMATRQL